MKMLFGIAPNEGAFQGWLGYYGDWFVEQAAEACGNGIESN